MKKRVIILMILVGIVSFGLLYSAVDSYFYSVISTPNKAINFTIGVYHTNFVWNETAKSGYTVIPGVIINDKTAKPLQWNDYKIFIMLKDGTLFNSYLTVAKTGRYACNYTVNPGEKHYQDFTFSKKFKARDIAAMWLKLTDGNFIRLIYFNKNKKQATPASETIH